MRPSALIFAFGLALAATVDVRAESDANPASFLPVAGGVRIGAAAGCVYPGYAHGPCCAGYGCYELDPLYGFELRRELRTMRKRFDLTLRDLEAQTQAEKSQLGVPFSARGMTQLGPLENLQPEYRDTGQVRPEFDSVGKPIAGGQQD